MLKQKKAALIAIIFLWLNGCTGLPRTQPTIIDTASASSTPLPIASALPPTSVLATITVSPTSTVVAVKQQCLEVTNELPSDVLTEGTILVWDNAPFRLDLATRQKHSLSTTTDGSTILGWAVSQNGQWLAYIEEVHDQTNRSAEQWFRLMTANGEEVIAFRWEDSYGPEWTLQWLGNQLLRIFPPTSPDGAHVYLDPWTQQTQELLPTSFPDIHFDLDIEPMAESPALAPDHVLTRAVYVRDVTMGDIHLAYSLRDIPSRQELWQRGGVELVIPPQWSPDWSQVAVVARPDEKDFWHTDIFSVSRGGQETQLTNFKELYPFALVGHFAWSPNGRYIAFWVDIRQNSKQVVPEQLAVLEVASRQVTNYCIVGNGTFSDAPVWSPDSQQLVVYNNHGILVDIVKAFAVQLPEDLTPIAWMVNYP